MYRKVTVLFVLLVINSQLFQLSSCSESIEETKVIMLRELSGEHLRFSACHDPPFMNEHIGPNGTLIYSGFVKNIAESMAEMLNISYTFVQVPKSEVDEFGPLQASINMLMRKEVDVVTRIMGLTLDYYTRMDCSLPLYLIGTTLIVPWPDQETAILAPIRPFEYKVWFFILISIIAVSLFLTWLPTSYRFYGANYITNQRFSSRIAAALNYVLSGEGDYSRWKQLSFRIFQGSWCIAAFVLVNAYSTTLVSNLTAPKLLPVARSYEDLVAPNPPQNLKLLVEKNEIAAKYAMEQAKSGFWKALGDIWRENPDLLFTDRQKGFEMLFTSRRFAYVGTEARVVSYMDMAYKRAKGQCEFTVSNYSMSRQYSMVWTFPKHWRYTDAVNDKLKWWPESGLMQYWRYEFQIMRGIDECILPVDRAISSKNGDDRKVITLGNLSGPFLFLILGMSLSILVFLLEIIYYDYIKRRTAIITQ